MTVVMIIMQKIVREASRTTAATVAARFPASAGLPPSTGFLCVFEA